ncbi:hypothetical protein DPMN_062106 [Dreissena polymorpha]|uniref:Uncharacterized protein n=1 Tax=Dreissena polymorpha TaxID=45954 RepID=A0A9D4C8X8_DREPO|nr:hypothetical protein DPMN_062106 [Dreissena polymorpha]
MSLQHLLSWFSSHCFLGPSPYKISTGCCPGPPHPVGVVPTKADVQVPPTAVIQISSAAVV